MDLGNASDINSGQRLLASYECLECGRLFRLKKSVVEHLSQHAGFSPYPCVTCGKRYFRPSSLRTHCHESGHRLESPLVAAKEDERVRAIRQRYRLLLPKLSRVYECLECRAVCATRQGIRFHLCRHARWSPIRCRKCSRRFYRPSAFRQHILQSRIKGESQCCQSDLFKPFRPDDLQEQLKRFRVIEAQRPKKGKPKSNQERRRKALPDSAKPYQCLICRRRFLLERSVIEHLGVTHANWSAYSCPSCSAHFHRRSALETHAALASHTLSEHDGPNMPTSDVRETLKRYRRGFPKMRTRPRDQIFDC